MNVSVCVTTTSKLVAGCVLSVPAKWQLQNRWLGRTPANPETQGMPASVGKIFTYLGRRKIKVRRQGEITKKDCIGIVIRALLMGTSCVYGYLSSFCINSTFLKWLAFPVVPARRYTGKEEC